MAHRIDIGEPAHDAERIAFDFLENALPASYTMFTNPTLVNANGVAREVDVVIAAPHAIFVVEVKSFGGRIEGTDHDWYVPHRVPSPVPKNRQTAQMLNGELRRRTYEAGQAWVQGLVFLSHTTQVGELGPMSRDRVVTRKSVIDALTNVEFTQRLSRRRSLPDVTDGTVSELMLLLQQTDRRQRAIRDFTVLDQLEGTDRYAEYACSHRITKEARILRVYTTPPNASPERRERLTTRVMWEAQVLRRLGRHPCILDADQPFEDEVGLVLPLEEFQGISLPGWLEKHGSSGPGVLERSVEIWSRVVETLAYAHKHGVIHRLLRPEAVLLADVAVQPDLRVTDFDLAKQIEAGVTVTWTSVPDDRRRWSAPEVLQNFSDADHRSDQFSLGALLGLLLTGKPLFESTADLIRDPHLTRRLRGTHLRAPQSLDDAIARMIQVRPTDRFPSLDEALAAVKGALIGSTKPAPPTVADPEDLQPGERAGPDHQIEARIGEGGSGIVYAATHRLSGAVHVLKVAKPGHEDALTAEFNALHSLQHDNIVRPITLSQMFPGRITLVMERAGKQTLAQWMAHTDEPHANTQRRLAEDLLAVLQYLESEADVVHKDIKPDNLLVNAAGGLVLIDFSAVDAPADAPFAGTPSYRDPAWSGWSHVTDRYAAMVVLFELYVGRHPFGGRAPEPDAVATLEDSEIDAVGLVDFFAKALHPDPSQRPSSAVALRQALLGALGDRPGSRPEIRASVPSPTLDTGLRDLGLPNRAANQLRRSGVRTARELIGLTDAQIHAIRAVGSKTARAVIDVRERLKRGGLVPPEVTTQVAQPLLPHLTDDTEAIPVLGLPANLTERLVDGGFTTVGELANTTRDDILAVPGLGAGKLAVVLRALHSRADAQSGSGGIATLDSLWDRLVAPLNDRQRFILDAAVGMTVPALRQVDIAASLGISQPAVSVQLTAATNKIDRRVFETPRDYVVRMVSDLGGGAMSTDEAASRLLEKWEGEPQRAQGWLRLIAFLAADRLALHHLDDLQHPTLTRANLTKADLAVFVKEARRQAQWPPKPPEASRRAVRMVIPENRLPGDPLTVAVRLLDDVASTDRGELFAPPLSAAHAVQYALETERPPLSIERLHERVAEAFGPDAPTVHDSALTDILQPLGLRVEGGRILDVDLASVQTDAALLQGDALPMALALDPGEQVAAMLEAARAHRGFRMLVVPPQEHRAIATSVARRLGVPLTSFAHCWFEQHEDQLEMLEKAERFKAQRRKLSRAADETFDALLEAHGTPGTTTVVGDLAILGVLDAHDLIRRWYDEVKGGDRGFWVLVVPGVIRERQPFFNGRDPLFHLDGSTLPLPVAVSPGAP